MAVVPRQNVSLVETWAMTDWSGYDTYQAFTDNASMGRLPGASYPSSLATQRHINLRTFNEPAGWTASAGTYTPGYFSAQNHWPGATIAVPSATSRFGDLFTSNLTTPIDISQVGPTGLLTMALPNFALTNLDLNHTTLELSSDGFVAAICALPWATSTPSPSSGNTSLTWPLSALTGVDLTKITGVRLRVVTTGAVTMTAMALKVIDPGWIQTNVDFDNLTRQLRPPVARNGDSTAVVPPNAIMPILWRSAQVTGVDDPRPINAKIGYVFNTGSQTQTNSFTLYMREGEAAPSQLDLQGLPQATLQNHPQPTAGVSQYAPRTQGDLDRLTQSELEGMTMLDMERLNAPTTSSYISFNVTWGPTPSIQVTNSANQTGGYQYAGTQAPTLANNTSYFVLCTLNDTGAQLTIYSINQTTQALGAIVFDTTFIPDGYLFKRRAGRIGYRANLQDGDTYIQAMRPQSLMFAEYRSSPLNSITPVVGAQIYVTSSPNLEYWSSWVATSADGNGNLPIISLDGDRTIRHVAANPDVNQSGVAIPYSTKVTVVTPDTSIRTSAQGVLSNVLSLNAVDGITNLGQTQISFDLWFPSAAVNAGSSIQAQLINSNGGVVQLNVPRIIPDQWQHVVLTSVPSVNLLAGLYTLKVYYLGSVSATWWIDNVSVFERVMRWSARAVADDPWHANTTPWTDFQELVNSDIDGVRFYQRGTQLQMRGQAMRQNTVVIGSPKLVPKYAELGRLVWPEDTISTSWWQPTPAPLTPPVPAIASIGSVTHNVPVTFDASGSTTSSSIIGYHWAFGDGGSGSGVKPTHTFTTVGTYTGTLTITDQYGATGILTFQIGVS